MAGKLSATVRVMESRYSEATHSCFDQPVDVVVTGLTKAEAEQAAMSVGARPGSDARLFGGARVPVTPELAARLLREALARRVASKRQIAAERSSR